VRHWNWPILSCLLFWALVISACNGVFSTAYDQQDFEEWARSQKADTLYETMHNIQTWMDAHMQYEPDGVIDYFRHPLKTWWQRGDCEDWAGVAIAALEINGYTDFWLQSVWYGDDGHTVCTDGTYHLGNWGLFQVPPREQDPYRNVAFAVSADWTEFTVRDSNLNVITRGNR